ncbi:SMP-30/gluconolactonase/LRE family protein [Congregibacter variabilis]|uniref:SMP-30/gluconolactonase/LRE family protein n=1 Tax=Congregibacter variabilis TaxID=3081200 RepID=A0ABZ0I679_9GAMM|nr:SMP-30/gluconolactonase/LRE family protein [Congregibacter sp. IMCC43200]
MSPQSSLDFPSVRVRTQPSSVEEHEIPEGLAIDGEGRVYLGTVDGKIYRSVNIKQPYSFALWSHTGGFPIGLAFEASTQSMWVANYSVGVQKVEPSGQFASVLTAYQGEKLGFIDDLVVAGDGTVYLTEASTKFTPLNYAETEPFILWEVLEGRPHGRVLSFKPQSGLVDVLVDHSYFPSGIALNSDESALYFIEVTPARLMRHWLLGERKGLTELVLADLPGVPDDVIIDDEDRLWISLASERDTFTDQWIQPHPWVKKLISRLPAQWLLGFQQVPRSGSLLRVQLGSDETCHMRFSDQLSPGNLQVVNDRILMSTLNGSRISELAFDSADDC